MAIPNMTPELADSIISSRRRWRRRHNECPGVLGENYSLMSQYITTASSNVFSIDAVGRKENEKGAYAIRATVVLTQRLPLTNCPINLFTTKKPVTITQ